MRRLYRYCDEGERIGGDNARHRRLAYFGLAVGF